VYPQFNEAAKFGNVHIEVGMEFDNLATFKAALRDYTIHLGREIKRVKNDKTRARAKYVRSLNVLGRFFVLGVKFIKVIK
jgi:hypothetical protein